MCWEGKMPCLKACKIQNCNLQEGNLQIAKVGRDVSKKWGTNGSVRKGCIRESGGEVFFKKKLCRPQDGGGWVKREGGRKRGGRCCSWWITERWVEVKRKGEAELRKRLIQQEGRGRRIKPKQKKPLQRQLPNSLIYDKLTPAGWKFTTFLREILH